MKTSFHKKIYPVAAVKATAAAFSDGAKISVTRDGAYTVVDLESGDPAEDVEYLCEFENYVMGETISMRGVK